MSGLAQLPNCLLRLTDKRERFLSLSDAVKQASLDPYTFTRDAYLQKRSERYLRRQSTHGG